MSEAPDSTHRKMAVLTPVEAGDLAALKQWITLTCRGRTVTQLSAQFNVEESMEAVVRRITRGMNESDRAVAAKLCERELNRAARDASRRFVAWLTPTIALASITAVALGDPGQDHQPSGPVYELSEVEVTDVAAMKVWAEDWCRGATVHDLAGALGLEETKAAVVAHLAWGLTGEARQAVIEVCERELLEDPDQRVK